MKHSHAAKIDLRAKEVFTASGKINAYHSYLVLTLSNNSQYILRAGPTNQNPLTGDVFVMGADRLLPYSQATDHIHHDWDANSTHLSSTLISGEDMQMLGLFDTMQAKGRQINWSHYDYEIVRQNCNTATAEMVHATGMELKLPESQGTPIALIGMETGFNDGIIDRAIKYIENLHAPTEVKVTAMPEKNLEHAVKQEVNFGILN